jgi:hypothetical protein
MPPPVALPSTTLVNAKYFDLFAKAKRDYNHAA